MPRGLDRHRRRSSSVSFNSRPMIMPPSGSPYQPVSSIPIPTNQSHYNYHGGSPYNTSGSPHNTSGSPYHTGGSPYHTGGSPYHTGGSPYSSSLPYHGTSYQHQYPGGVQGLPVVGSGYDPNQALYQNPGSFPQQNYIQAQPGMSQALPMAPGTALVIHQPTQQSSRRRSHHKHSSGSRDSRRRHRSHSDAGYVY